MKYSRAALEGRNWHKVVIDDLHRINVTRVFLPHLTGDYMVASGGHWILVMLDSDHDLAALQLMTDFPPENYRGCGDWSKKKYYNAKGNRITP